MKSFHLALLLLPFQIMVCTAAAAAQESTSPVLSWPAQLLQSRGEDPSLPHTFICQSNPRSSFNTHVLAGADELIRERGHHWCTQDNREGSMCTQLFKYGTASITMCGDYRTKYRCNVLAKGIQQFSKACATKFGGKFRLAGKAIYSWGEVRVSDKWLGW